MKKLVQNHTNLVGGKAGIQDPEPSLLATMLCCL